MKTEVCINHVRKLYEIKDFYEMLRLTSNDEKVEQIELSLGYVISLIEEFTVKQLSWKN